MLGNPDFYTIEQLKEYFMWPVGFLPARGMIPYLKRLGQDLVGIEVGVLKGENAYVLLSELPNIKMLYGVDNYKPHTDYGLVRTEEDMVNYKETAIKNLEPFVDRFRFVEYDYREASLYKEIFTNESIDFVLLDLYHNFEETIEQLYQFYPVLKRGGYIFINDCHVEEIKAAVIDYRATHKIRIPLHTSANNVMFWQKS